MGGEDVQGLTRKVGDNDRLQLGALAIKCLLTPSHTNGHTSYLVSSDGEDGAQAAVFTGDALFVGGCGRFFEGTPAQMVATSAKLAALPPETLLFCGHEYTIKNLQFALSVEPQNQAAEVKILWAQEARSQGRCTVPSSIREELTFNPFMRIAQASVREYIGGGTDDADVMRKLRNKKDQFAGSSRPWIPGGGPLPGL